MNRRNLLLNEMGISQWQLHKPDVLKGAVQICLHENIRLVIISDQAINKSAVLFNDILLALNLSEKNCLIIDFDQARYLNPNEFAVYWLLSKNAEKTDRALSDLKSFRVWQSSEFSTFSHSSQEKRRLWQQILQHLSQISD